MPLCKYAVCPAPRFRPEQTVAEAIRLMVTRPCGAVIVMEEEKVLGIFTERDVLTRVLDKGFDASLTRLAEVMSTHVERIHRDAPLEDALALMQHNNFRFLPLVDAQDEVVGVMSMSLVFRAYSDVISDQLRRNAEANCDDIPL